jgi:hypothetical protein
MNLIVAAYAAILFFLLSPGVLLRLPPKGSKFIVLATHAVIFAIILGLTCKMVWKFSMGIRLEGMDGMEEEEKKKEEEKQVAEPSQ